jgi:RNA polymerase sigma-70 factor (ECF subfamily)
VSPTPGVKPQSTDAELVAAAADGDRLALAALYDRYAPLLLALANRLLRHQREAEDLLHDVFLEVWRQAADYDPSRGSVRAWLVMRLRSRALDRLKSVRHTRVVSLESTSLPEEPQANAPEQTFGHDQAMVRDALQALPADQRVVLEMAYFEGLSLSEIATKLDVPIGTIKSRLARALTRLRDTLHALSDEADS